MNALRERVGEAAIRGFRAPYYNFDPDIPRILEEMGYLWDSTKAYFPILGRPFRAERHGGIVELPSLHPDDHTLLRRIGLTEEQVLHTWTKSYNMSTEVFVWGIHPYICAENSLRTNMLECFIEYIRDDGGIFMSLSDIAKKYTM
jgi:peptidoglycan/xylan/chitin deacetylase (PgdA/CDA1 family)